MNARAVFHAVILSAGLLLTGLAPAQPASVSLWVHAGPGPERDVYVESVKRFNAAQQAVRVEVVARPEGGYTEQVEAAARSKALPCILELDGPTVSYWASRGKLRALDGYPWLPKLKRSLLRTIEQQGSYAGSIYSVGQYDSGLALWGNRRLLLTAGVRIPSGTRNAWSLEEFEGTLKVLKEQGVAWPLDAKLNYGIGEWLTYGFLPLVQSFGGDLVDRRAYKTAQGVVNGPGAVKALMLMQGWVRKGYVNPHPTGDLDFVQGRSALSYVGHWVYRDYKKALGDDLLLIPMPRFGAKAVTGAGSWSWAITSDCRYPDAAAAVLQHFMSSDEVLAVTQANGAVPATLDAILSSPGYSMEGPLRLYVDQILEGVAKVRPLTPAYPELTKSFARAVAAVIDGADAKTELDRAAREIDKALAAH